MLGRRPTWMGLARGRFWRATRLARWFCSREDNCKHAECAAAGRKKRLTPFSHRTRNSGSCRRKRSLLDTNLSTEISGLGSPS